MRTQQDELYAAERRGIRGVELPDIEAVEAWVHRKMLDTDWWNDRFPCVRGIVVHPARRGDGSVGAWFADDCTGQIEMSPAHWCEQYLCHEVAHVCAGSDGQSHGHDPVFARIYLELVFRCMGDLAWTTLRDSFIESGIEF